MLQKLFLHLVYQVVHTSMVNPRTNPIEAKSACSARELENYEDVQEDTKLEESGSVEVEWGDGCEICNGWRGGLCEGLAWLIKSQENL